MYAQEDFEALRAESDIGKGHIALLATVVEDEAFLENAQYVIALASVITRLHVLHLVGIEYFEVECLVVSGKSFPSRYVLGPVFHQWLDVLGVRMPGLGGPCSISDSLHWMQQNSREAQSLARIIALWYISTTCVNAIGSRKISHSPTIAYIIRPDKSSSHQ